jgi:hypothetical protein
VKEAERRSCTDPRRLRAFLVDKASARKLRLFDCACCRRLWPALPPESRRAVEGAEDFTDDSTDLAQLLAAFDLLLGKE